MQMGYDSLLPSRIPPLGSNITERVVALTQTAPPTEATHWTSAMMARHVNLHAGRDHALRTAPSPITIFESGDMHSNCYFRRSLKRLALPSEAGPLTRTMSLKKNSSFRIDRHVI